jgi:hypothetical protein
LYFFDRYTKGRNQDEVNFNKGRICNALNLSTLAHHFYNKVTNNDKEIKLRAIINQA